MNLLPTFGFKGKILPIIDKTDKLYILIENENEHRVLLNIVSTNINKFVNIDSFSSKIINIGHFSSELQTKIFYLGQELFDFSCKNVDKEILLYYSNYIIKKESIIDDISFSVSFLNGLELKSESKYPQNLYIKIVDNDKEEIIHEDNFLSGDPYVFRKNYFINYGISVFNTDGKKVYTYNLNLENKNVLISLKNCSIGDSIEFVPYISEFRKKHKCSVFCVTNWNNLFISEYPDLIFVDSDETIEEKTLFAVYVINPLKKEMELEKFISKTLGIECKKIKLNNVLEHMRKITTVNNI